MKVTIIICTLNRPAILHDTLLSIQRQIHLPVQILISSPNEEHVLPETRAIPGVEFVVAPVGSSTQRNRALDRVNESSDLVVFLDDDIELCRSYLSEMVRLFEERKEIVIASGVMLHDGGRSSIISRGEARNLCVAHDSQGSSSTALSYTPMDFAYGCNMVCRYSRIRSIRFDERLPLYAWLEDSDFSHRATRGFHEPVRCLSAIAVHLGWRAGRFSGLRLGFSTIVNPVYLRRKSGTFTIKFILVNLWARCLAGNIIGILTRDKEYDRVGLLRGNLVGFIHLLSGRCDPAHILEL